MSWMEVASGVIKIILWILGAVKESNDSIKQVKTEIINDATKAIINRDASSYNLVLDRINRIGWMR